MEKIVRVTVWNEFRHEKKSEAVRAIYPEGMHAVIAGHLNRQPGLRAAAATLDEPEHGLTEAVLTETDVLTWWGHTAHHLVADEIVERVHRRVLDGMGLVCLHSAHLSKIFRRVLGTSGALRWRDIGEKQRFWNLEPGHPVTEGLGEYFELPAEEMYGERFDIPTPDKLVFISWYAGGDVFRSGCCWERGHGRIFYFQPGHELYPSFHDPNVLRVITNAVRWAAPRIIQTEKCRQAKEPLEEVPPKA